MNSLPHLLSVLSILACVSAQCDSGVNDGVNNCNTVPRLISINCMKDMPCTCSDSTNSTAGIGYCTDYPSLEDLDSVISYDTATGDKCEEMCKAIWDDEGVSDVSKKCQYYKFEEVPRYLPDEGRNCYFMNVDQCLEEAPLPCENHCQSGQIDCGDIDATTAPPEPTDTTCPVKMPELVPGNIHWRCLHGNEEVTPYGEKATGLPLGTVCTSIHPCYKFPDDDENASDYHLSFKCEEHATTIADGTTAEPTTLEPTTLEPTTLEPTTLEPTTLGPLRRSAHKSSRALNEGSWVSQTQAKYSSDNEIFMEGALTDPLCSALPLLLDNDNYHQEGLLLQCTDTQVDMTGDDPVIHAPNTCFLFCNFYSVMKIDTKWRDDYQPDELNTGEKVWRYVISGTGDEYIFPKKEGSDSQTAAEEIKCWGF